MELKSRGELEDRIRELKIIIEEKDKELRDFNVLLEEANSLLISSIKHNNTLFVENKELRGRTIWPSMKEKDYIH